MRPKSTHSPNKAGTRGSKNSPAKGNNSQGRILRSRTVSGEVSPSSSNNGSPRLRRTSTASSASVDDQGSTRQSGVRQTAANSKNASPKPRTSPRTRNESGKAGQSPKCARTREEVSPVQASSPNPKRVRRNLNESFDSDSKAESTSQEAKNNIGGKVENGMNGSSGSVKPSDSSEPSAGTCSSCGKTPVCGNHIACSTKSTEDESTQPSLLSGSEHTKHSCKCRTQTSTGTSQCKHKDTSSGSSELNSSLRNRDQGEVVNQDQEKPHASGGESESKQEEQVDDSFPTVDYRKLENEDYSQPFYFESDHVALKDNKEYHLMLKTLVMLEAQRSQAVQDIDRLAVKEEEALKDPIDFVEKLQCNAVSLPRSQSILDLPSIQWENYAGWVGKVDPSLFMPAKRHLTRTKRQPEATITSSDSASNCGEGGSQQGPSRGEEGPQVVRGRLRGPSKPATFNQLWTTEEQRKLEYLLEVFPPEEIEARRWQKIAEALGNRTSKQVASRVQKYFIKLAKAGLPIPGRMPANNHTFSKKLPFMQKYRRHDMFRQGLCQPSTFMTSHLPPVYMSDNDDDSTSQSTSQFDWEQDMEDVSDDESVPVELRQTEDYRELMRLKRLKMLKERRKKQEESMGITQHVGYRCDRCECDPIMGVRWHCLDCPTDTGVDFCQDCVDCDHETEVHKSYHRLEPISHMSEHTYMDMDYTRFSVKTGDYNYLDPNYFPSTS
ncbi:ZZ-type zinc finger-containing protein 3-like isoform X1 [Branchiostoma floridae x Branchiostoma japonicum]